MKYRVDRAKGKTVPVGMNSILYLGESRSKAVHAFNDALPGFDEWTKPDDSYGVLLSSWSGNYSDTDTIIDFKN